jgi:hypothetical protein
MDITNWFKTKVKLEENTLPRYFIFNEIGHVQILFNIDSLNNYYQIGSIKWKWNKTPLKILKKKTIDNTSYKFTESKYNLEHIPILKSNLQKCIRRSNTENALKTAYQMLLIDPNSILRRLPIIYVEDVEIDSSFAVIVWYMIAVSKHYDLTKNDIMWILGVVNHLSNNTNKEILKNSNISKIDDHLEFIKLMKGEYYQNNKNIFWALLLRYLYGGMKGDLKLFIDCLLTYKDKPIKEYKIELIKISTVKKFSKKNILLESVDFHCTNILQNLMRKLGIDSTQEQLYKQCIWSNRSSITNKNGSKNLKEHTELYRCIKRYLDDMSQEIIDRKF